MSSLATVTNSMILNHFCIQRIQIFRDGSQYVLDINSASETLTLAALLLVQVLSTLLPRIHFSLPSGVDASGRKKEIYWKMNGPQIPVVRAPFGDGISPQVPLGVRLVKEVDFSW